MNTPGHRLDNESLSSPRRGGHFSTQSEDEMLFSLGLDEVRDPAQSVQASQTPHAQQAPQVQAAAQPRAAKRTINVPQIDQVTRPMAAQPQAQAPSADPYATRVVDLSSEDEPAYQAYSPEPAYSAYGEDTAAPAFDPFEYQPQAPAVTPSYQPYEPVNQDYQAYEAPAYQEPTSGYYDYEEEPAPRFSEFSPIKKGLLVGIIVALFACIVAEALAIFAQPSTSESSVSQAEDANTQYLKNGELSNDPNTLEDES